MPSTKQSIEHELPTIRSTITGYTNLAKLSEATSQLVDCNLIIKFANCGFFDGNMTAPLQVVLEKIVDQGNSISLIDFPPSVGALLCKNDFLCQFGYKKILDINGTTLPHKVFDKSDSIGFSAYLKKNLQGKGIPEMTEGLGKKFRQSIFEVFQNCAMHAKSKAGISVSGQFYPKEHHLDLTISDAGVGIRTNVREFLKCEMSSIDAIKWAMIEGNTTKTGTQPGGFGLKLLQEFIELNNGKVQIISRDGFYEFSGGIKKYHKMNADFPGTAINLQINTSDKKFYRLKSEIANKLGNK